MPTALPLGASRLRHLLSRWRLPTQCLLCHQWQAQALCAPCLTRWRRPMRRCRRCAIGLAPSAHEAVCQRCEDLSPEFDRAIAALDYEPPWASVLGQLKFQDGIALARPLAGLLHDAICRHPHPVDLIVPVPLSRARLLERGYNQSWLLAQQLARRQDRPAHHDLLHRARHTERLMTLDADERRLHIQGAFTVPAAAQALLRRRHIALVDDVLTTGATLNEAARTLREAGARSVSAWVLARTPAPAQARRPPPQA